MVGALRFVVIVWGVALAFRGVKDGGAIAVDWALSSGPIGACWGVQRDESTCGNVVAVSTAPFDPGQVRALAFELGFGTGLDAGIRSTETGARQNASVNAAAAAAAQALGVPLPEMPLGAHQVNAISDFVANVAADPGCIAARLDNTYGKRRGDLYRVGLIAGFVSWYRMNFPQLGATLVPELRCYAERSAAPGVILEHLSTAPVALPPAAAIAQTEAWKKAVSDSLFADKSP